MMLQVNGYVSPYPVDPMPDWVAALRDSAAPVWLFAYGSLMWNPEMPFAERRPALLRGWHRSFCLYSRDYRGTRNAQGLSSGSTVAGHARVSPIGSRRRGWARRSTRFGRAKWRARSTACGRSA